MTSTSQLAALTLALAYLSMFSIASAAKPAAPPIDLATAQKLHGELSATARAHDQAWHDHQLTRGEGVGYRRHHFYTDIKRVFSPTITTDTGKPNMVRLGPWLDHRSAVTVDKRRGAILIATPAQGFHPGDTFIVTKKGVLKRGWSSTESAPTVGSHGGFEWSTPRAYQNEQRIPATEADLTELRTVLKTVSALKRKHAREQAAAPPPRD